MGPEKQPWTEAWDQAWEAYQAQEKLGGDEMAALRNRAKQETLPTSFEQRTMLSKILFRFAALFLAVMLMFLISCMNNKPNTGPNSLPATHAGSAANPKTATKKETGGS